MLGMIHKKYSIKIIFLCLVGIFSSTDLFAQPSLPGRSNVHFYAAIYAYDAGPFSLPKDTHSYAGFMAVDHSTGRVVERFAISWLPIDANVRAIDVVEPGRNFPLDETMNIALANHYQVTKLGPKEVTPRLFELARNQWGRLERATRDGSIGYLLLDGISRFAPRPSVNCIHAVSDLAGVLRTGLKSGRSGSVAIDEYFTPFYVSQNVHPIVQQMFIDFEHGR